MDQPDPEVLRARQLIADLNELNVELFNSLAHEQHIAEIQAKLAALFAPYSITVARRPTALPLNPALADCFHLSGPDEIREFLVDVQETDWSRQALVR